jgi:hypothetical protein
MLRYVPEPFPNVELFAMIENVFDAKVTEADFTTTRGCRTRRRP